MVLAEKNMRLHGQLICDKGDKDIQWGKASSINDVGKTGHLHAKETGLFTLYKKNSK